MSSTATSDSKGDTDWRNDQLDKKAKRLDRDILRRTSLEGLDRAPFPPDVFDTSDVPHEEWVALVDDAER